MKGVQRTIRRRRREAKTDYLARLELLKSKKPRIVIRRTNNYIIAQLIQSDVAQDKVLVGISSKDLLSQGWPQKLQGSLKSIPAGYLTGRLLASKMPKDVGAVIVDLGMQRHTSGGRLAAVVKGLVDGGIKVPHSGESLPDEKRLESNKATRETFLKLKEGFKK